MWFEQPIEVIPAVDVLGVEAVRLHQGDYEAVVERAGEPVRAGRALGRGGRQAGPPRRPRRRALGPVRPELVRAVVVERGPARVQASGGIRTLADARSLLDAGADRVVVGTAAWPDPPVARALGDASCSRSTSATARSARRAGREAPGSRSPRRSSGAAGARASSCTAIDRDGTLAGPDLELVGKAAAAGLRVLAAGGVRSAADVERSPPPAAEAASRRPGASRLSWARTATGRYRAQLRTAHRKDMSGG